MTMYGYCRVYTNRQKYEYQANIILSQFPEAIIVKEKYNGPGFFGREMLDNILIKIKPEDVIIFESVIRMSLTISGAFKLYQELFNNNITLIFIKEPYLNTDSYKKITDNNEIIMQFAKEQIRIAFEQSEKDAAHHSQRTKDGLEIARSNGKQLGQKQGSTYETKKSIASKKIIRQYNKAFDGNLNDIETMKLAGCARKSYYKYKKELLSGRPQDQFKEETYDE